MVGIAKASPKYLRFYSTYFCGNVKIEFSTASQPISISGYCPLKFTHKGTLSRDCCPPPMTSLSLTPWCPWHRRVWLTHRCLSQRCLSQRFALDLQIRIFLQNQNYLWIKAQIVYLVYIRVHSQNVSWSNKKKGLFMYCNIFIT